MDSALGREDALQELPDKIRDWLEKISREDELPHDVQGVYIGLLDGEETFLMRLAGSKEYDPDNSGWACNQDFTPEREYLDTGVSTNKDWKDLERVVVSTVRSLTGATGPAVLNKAKHVSVGFDSGSLTKIT